MEQSSPLHSPAPVMGDFLVIPIIVRGSAIKHEANALYKVAYVSCGVNTGCISILYHTNLCSTNLFKQHQLLNTAR